jgi:iron complex transport system substrate-binding protein
LPRTRRNSCSRPAPEHGWSASWPTAIGLRTLAACLASATPTRSTWSASWRWHRIWSSRGPTRCPLSWPRLRARGATIFVSDPKSIAGIARDVEALGTLAATAATAQPAAAALRARHDALAAKFRGAPAISVFYEVWNEPLQTIGGGHLISEAITLCGGRNIFAALTSPAPTVSLEAVIAARPDAIIAGSDDGRRPAWLDDWRRWRDVPAVRYDNLFVANGDLLHRSGPALSSTASRRYAGCSATRAPRAKVR